MKHHNPYLKCNPPSHTQVFKQSSPFLPQLLCETRLLLILHSVILICMVSFFFLTYTLSLSMSFQNRWLSLSQCFPTLPVLPFPLMIPLGSPWILSLFPELEVSKHMPLHPYLPCSNSSCMARPD